MKIMVCVAGLPVEVVDELRRRSPASFTEDKANPPIVRPVKLPYTYRHGMSDAYLGELANRLEGPFRQEHVAILLAYVDYGDEANSLFVRRFFPFALTAPIRPFYPNSAPPHERRHNFLRYVDDIEAVVAGLRVRARAVRNFLSGVENHTPLLLPLRNFQSNVLKPQIERLFYDRGTVENLRAELDKAKKAILDSHPLQRLQGRGEHKSFFQDDRDLRFKSPGRNRHGMARLVDREHGHEPCCLINSRVRLGGPFDALFHYDCDYERGGVDPSYPNCHGADAGPAHTTYVNIAPSDAIR
jgi:hypothetical protein